MLGPSAQEEEEGAVAEEEENQESPLLFKPGRIGAADG